MVGAHLHSVNAGLGINDNGSGSVAIIEAAAQMAKAKPRNRPRFALWGGTAGIQYDPCYHQACDTYANNNDYALAAKADAVACSTLQFAMNTAEVNRQRGKGNFNPATLPDPHNQAQ